MIHLPPSEQTKGYRIYSCDSPVDFLDTLKKSVAYNDSRGIERLHDDEWTGKRFEDWNDLYDHVARPHLWTDGLTMMDEMIRQIQDEDIPKPLEKRRRRRFSEYDGDEFHIDRFMIGADPWETRQREFREGPQSLTLFVNLSTKCTTSSRDIMWRGAAALTLSHYLELGGWSTRIVAVDRGTSCLTNNDSVAISVVIKEFGEPYSLPSLASYLSSWFFRIPILQMLNQPCLPGVTATAWHGRPEEIDEEFVSVLPMRHGKSIVTPDMWDLNHCVSFIRYTIETLNKEARDHVA